MAVRLQPRDRKLLQHTARYGITTPEALRRRFFADSEDAVKNVIRRLRGAYLESFPLYGMRVYYRPTLEATKLLGEPESLASPLGPQALPMLYGVLAYCCLGEVMRQVFTKDEFRRAFPEFADALPLDHHAYYIDYDGARARLGRIVPDLGGGYERIVKRLKDIVEKGLEIPGLRKLIDEQQFVLALVTGEPEKAQAVREGWSKERLGVWLRLEVVPELSELRRGNPPQKESRR